MASPPQPHADHGTPIFDTLAAEVGLEWPGACVGWFDPATPPVPDPAD